MGKVTNIEWCDHTFNPWVGCTKVSPACDNCYAESWAKRTGQSALWNGERRRTTPANWNQPKKWNKQLEIKFNAWERFKAENQGVSDDELVAHGFIKPTRERVFCASLADVFDNQVPQEWRDDLFSLIQETPYLYWLILTKRIGNVDREMPANVWLGITVCNQQEADRDIPKLLNIPATIRFLSIEPMLGDIDLFEAKAMWGGPVSGGGESGPIEYDCVSFIDWVIVGGESGNKARPLNRNWARKIRDQCEASGTPLFFKQWGGRTPKSYGCLLDGREIKEFPKGSV